ncbi:unnamed protein product [Strongylus vulgaris]|uniref:Uncharacterized protein n=1 Tax=Strongylus vulgaris TaxID=40348 RepID=A0A3P7LZH1_STRVU|nr:unnamed protein product [Strongylus vulgaris]
MRLLPRSLAAALYRDPASIAAVNHRKSSVFANHMEAPSVVGPLRFFIYAYERIIRPIAEHK